MRILLFYFRKHMYYNDDLRIGLQKFNCWKFFFKLKLKYSFTNFMIFSVIQIHITQLFTARLKFFRFTAHPLFGLMYLPMLLSMLM